MSIMKNFAARIVDGLLVFGVSIVVTGSFWYTLTLPTDASVAMLSIRAPHEPSDMLPSPDEFRDVLVHLWDPDIPSRNKAQLLDGGLSDGMANFYDRYFNEGQKRGLFPLDFKVSDIHATGPGVVDAAVIVSGPRMSAHNGRFSFVHDGGWRVSKDSIERLVTEI